MPALPDVPNVLRILWSHHVGDDTHLGSRHYWLYSGSAPSVATCEAIAAEVTSLWATNLAPVCSAGVALDGVTVTDLSSSSAAEGSSTTAEAGTRSGAGLPAGVCATLGFQVARRYRGGKPRAFLPYPTDSDLDGPISWSAAYVAALDAAWEAYKTGLDGYTSGGCTLSDHVNVSYYEGFVVSTNPLTGRTRNVPKPRTTPLIDTVIGHLTDSTIGSQRRRNRPKGT